MNIVGSRHRDTDHKKFLKRLVKKKPFSDLRVIKPLGGAYAN